jgi:hypothetical protein
MPDAVVNSTNAKQGVKNGSLVNPKIHQYERYVADFAGKEVIDWG